MEKLREKQTINKCLMPSGDNRIKPIIIRNFAEMLGKGYETLLD